ncbi:hypothetical protein NB700_003724 [Xanthomonas sacchari]|uniref:Uncharacterized protein n=1 Tax=Xanthomonas sacchari TaxID=56458 RepID=A0ABT3E0D6_9XANT|nr:hypothetical protein [Xanthomonas sacchari]
MLIEPFQKQASRVINMPCLESKIFSSMDGLVQGIHFFVAFRVCLF